MENSIKIQLPISISYPALEGVLQKQMVGEYIPKTEAGTQEPPYARILDIRIAGMDTGMYDVMVRARIQILRTVLKRDQVDLIIMASLGYNNETQQVFVRNFNLDSRTPSGFYNTSLEVLANRVGYNQILKKARVNLREIISGELEKANGLLGKGLELKGIKLSGKVEQVAVRDIIPQADHLSLVLELQGNLDADIFDLLSLMPEK